MYNSLFKGMNLDEIKSFKGKKYDSIRIALAETFNNIKATNKNYKKNKAQLTCKQFMQIFLLII